MAATTRRNVLKGIIAVGGVASAGGYWATEARWVGAVDRRFGNVPKTLGPDRLFRDAERIYKQFMTAGGGEIFANFQNFWPRTLDDRGVASLETVIAAHEGDDPKHRRIVLPALAALHTLGSSDVDRDRLHTTIARIHSRTLQVEPLREVFESIWLNVTAAIIRSPDNWRNIVFDQ